MNLEIETLILALILLVILIISFTVLDLCCRGLETIISLLWRNNENSKTTSY